MRGAKGAAYPIRSLKGRGLGFALETPLSTPGQERGDPAHPWPGLASQSLPLATERFQFGPTTNSIHTRVKPSTFPGEEQSPFFTGRRTNWGTISLRLPC